MKIPIAIVDAFTDSRFSGTPAAVCVLPAPQESTWMQEVAREMNLSETAFLCRREDGFELRWFTPTVEVELCGHATLASAHVLWESGQLGLDEETRFHTLSGLLKACRKGDLIELDFPSEPELRVEPPPELLQALGVSSDYVGKNRFDYLVLVNSEDEVRRLIPDFTALSRISARGVIVTSLSKTPGFDFVSRFFAPQSGVNEDPVTGSAHCCLGPFWAGRLKKNELVGFQASRRGGEVRVCVHGARVMLQGKAVTVLRGELV